MEIKELTKTLSAMLPDRPKYIADVIEAQRRSGYSDESIAEDLQSLKETIEDPVFREHPDVLSSFLDDFLAFRKGMALTPPFMAK